jgi:hypothetical protein
VLKQTKRQALHRNFNVPVAQKNRRWLIFKCGLILLLLSYFAVAWAAPVEDPKLLLDKQGIFKIIDWGIYTHYDCGFTKVETSANAEKIAALVATIKKNNPVLNETRGFNGNARLYAEHCPSRAGYGIRGIITFEFCSWFRYKGEEGFVHVEPPHWDLYLNDLDARGSGYACNESTSTRKDFNLQQYREACARLREIFGTYLHKETLAPGIDRYNGSIIVVYNPERPPYWLPVTVREAYTLLLDYWKLRPDWKPNDEMVKVLEDEFASYTETQKNGQAYGGGIFGFCADNHGVPVMRANPASWNKTLPKSAVQIFSFFCPADKADWKRQMESVLKRDGFEYHEYRFIDALDINLFKDMIDK